MRQRGEPMLKDRSGARLADLLLLACVPPLEVCCQELPGPVQRIGRFVEDRVEVREDVRHLGGQVEGDRDVENFPSVAAAQAPARLAVGGVSRHHRIAVIRVA
jgi:hypothetical protein